MDPQAQEEGLFKRIGGILVPAGRRIAEQATEAVEEAVRVAPINPPAPAPQQGRRVGGLILPGGPMDSPQMELAAPPPATLESGTGVRALPEGPVAPPQHPGFVYESDRQEKFMRSAMMAEEHGGPGMSQEEALEVWKRDDAGAAMGAVTEIFGDNDEEYAAAVRLVHPQADVIRLENGDFIFRKNDREPWRQVNSPGLSQADWGMMAPAVLAAMFEGAGLAITRRPGIGSAAARSLTEAVKRGVPILRRGVLLGRAATAGRGLEKVAGAARTIAGAGGGGLAFGAAKQGAQSAAGTQRQGKLGIAGEVAFEGGLSLLGEAVPAAIRGIVVRSDVQAAMARGTLSLETIEAAERLGHKELIPILATFDAPMAQRFSKILAAMDSKYRAAVSGPRKTAEGRLEKWGGDEAFDEIDPLYQDRVKEVLDRQFENDVRWVMREIHAAPGTARSQAAKNLIERFRDQDKVAHLEEVMLWDKVPDHIPVAVEDAVRIQELAQRILAEYSTPGAMKEMPDGSFARGPDVDIENFDPEVRKYLEAVASWDPTAGGPGIPAKTIAMLRSSLFGPAFAGNTQAARRGKQLRSAADEVLQKTYRDHGGDSHRDWKLASDWSKRRKSKHEALEAVDQMITQTRQGDPLPYPERVLETIIRGDASETLGLIERWMGPNSLIPIRSAFVRELQTRMMENPRAARKWIEKLRDSDDGATIRKLIPDEATRTAMFGDGTAKNIGWLTQLERQDPAKIRDIVDGAMHSRAFFTKVLAEGDGGRAIIELRRSLEGLAPNDPLVVQTQLGIADWILQGSKATDPSQPGRRIVRDKLEARIAALKKHDAWKILTEDQRQLLGDTDFFLFLEKAAAGDTANSLEMASMAYQLLGFNILDPALKMATGKALGVAARSPAINTGVRATRRVREKMAVIPQGSQGERFHKEVTPRTFAGMLRFLESYDPEHGKGFREWEAERQSTARPAGL